MKLFKGAPRSLFLVAYAAVCVLAVSYTALLSLAPEIWLPAVFLQILLLYITTLCLMPEKRASISVLTRPAAIAIVLASGAINIGCFAFIHLETGLRDATGLSDSVSALDGLYFSVVTFTTLGFGDLQPFPQGRLSAALQALCGYVYLGLGIGLAVNGFRTNVGDGGDQNASR